MYENTKGLDKMFYMHPNDLYKGCDLPGETFTLATTKDSIHTE